MGPGCLLQSFNRRGLVFDKPQVIRTPDGPTAVSASDDTFGHSGFTGTFVWADPEEELVFIFLSNRVYPSRTHRNIYNLNIRPALQQAFYMSPKTIP